MDKLVIDIETKNTIADVGGPQNIPKLSMSFVGVYSYNQDKYLSFHEDRFDQLKLILQRAGLIIGFSSNRFDIPVLSRHFNLNLKSVESLDMLDEIEEKLGHRVGLDLLAQTNLGVGKTSHGLEAITFYKEGRLEELEKYCINDVKITKDLYELGKKQKYLLIPTNHGKDTKKVEFDWQEKMPLPNTLF
ncbi:MAG TPA: ribonuclease H-like domain-containing protein [Candidatus Paceibacterota bacterium]